MQRHRNFWRYVLLTAALEAEVVFFRQFDATGTLKLRDQSVPACSVGFIAGVSALVSDVAGWHCKVVLIRVLLTAWPAASRWLLVVCDPLCGTLSFALTWVAERSGWLQSPKNIQEHPTTPYSIDSAKQGPCCGPSKKIVNTDLTVLGKSLMAS